MSRRAVMISGLSAALLATTAASAKAPVRERAAAAPAHASPLPLPQIAFTRMVLANGLTLIVHEDHKAPVVAVNLWYHVGSKNEPPGRTGFAHLFEHLMFGSTGGNQRGWFERLEAAGATDINGTTANDRTNFFETVPNNALDMTLAMEAQRMGHLLDGFNETLLNTQRGVVQNEKRQDENQPYAVSDEIITKTVWPAQHPYSHTVIGEMTDLDAAKVADVKDWFSKYYGPTNATLVLAGDITPAEAKAKVERYFGAIPPGPPVARQKAWIAPRTGAQRAQAQDRVPQARLYVEWNVPPDGSDDEVRLELLADVLATGKDSRLYRRLVFQDQVATDVNASVDTREIGGLFDVELTAKSGVPLARVEAAAQEELARLLRDGPTAAELERYKTKEVSDFSRRAERVGGFGGQSDILASSQTYFDDPGAWRTRLERIQAATPQSVAAAGRRWLGDGSFTLEITPFPDVAPVSGAVAQATPAPGPASAPRFPAVRRATLANGLQLVVAERRGAATVEFDLVVDAGSASDPPGSAGLSTVEAAAMLDGPADLSALALDDRQTELGARLGASSGRDVTQVTLSALPSRVAPSLDLLADVALHPAFRPADVAREKTLQTARIQQDSQDPVAEALRLLPPLTYGRDHPYGRLATEQTIARLTSEALAAHHAAWFQPKGATLVVVGDTTLEAVRPLVEARFGAWRGAAPPHAVEIARTPPPAAPVVYLVDKPGALQSVIAAGVVAPPRLNPDELGIQAMNTALGGAFTSRLNLNLREDKHWAYGAFSFTQDTRKGGLFVALAPVQTDKTRESFVEARKELTDIVTGRPLDAREAELARRNLTLSLPGRWETSEAVARSLSEVATYGLPDDYYATFATRVGALSQGEIQRAAGVVLKAGALTWVVVGDRAKIQGPLESLGFSVRLIDPDGLPTR